MRWILEHITDKRRTLSQKKIYSIKHVKWYKNRRTFVSCVEDCKRDKKDLKPKADLTLLYCKCHTDNYYPVSF